MRWIAHVDMDSFFVSVERLLNPALIGKPVVVGGTGPRAVVASASYEVRKFGVRSAMPMSQALRLCPKLVVVRPNFSEYSRLSKLIFEELKNLSPLVEQVSIDEAYLDFTGCSNIYSSREVSGKLIKDSILKTSQLTSTVGIGTSKLIAKIASDQAKPNGLLIVPIGTEEKFLAPLSVKKIPGVGPKTATQLESLKIRTCAEFAKADLSQFRKDSHIHELQKYAKGIDLREVTPEHERKSLGAEETFDHDINDIHVLENFIREMSEKLGNYLRKEQIKARTIQLKIRYPDFTTVTRARTLSHATDQSPLIAQTAWELLHQNKISSRALRLIGVSLKNFESAEQESKQMELFSDSQTSKHQQIDKLKDQLRARFGEAVLMPTKNRP